MSEDVLPPMTEAMIEEVRGELVLLSIVTVAQSQFNFRVFPGEAERVLDEWCGSTRDGIAAISFWAQAIEGRHHIGKWTFATATIMSIRQYTQAEYDEFAAKVKVPGRG